jgi:alkanesulfonate monooxygenase SsuD/methylene tetrahydromethanopterin reductase-like flavin-dependent oxidoreductase (luciferase family)
MGSFRFSSNIFGLASRDEFAATCRRAENYGYDTIFAADHLGDAAPFQAAVAVAAATGRLRVGTLVLNVHEPYLDTFAPVIDRVRPGEVGARGAHLIGRS